MRRFLALIAVLLLAALVWWAVPRGTAPPPASGPSGAAPSAAENGSAQVPTRDAEAAKRVETQTVDPTEGAPLVSVKVRFKDSGAPAAGAEVTHPLPNSRPPDSDPKAQLRWSRLRFDRERHNKLYGRTLVASADGVVHVPLQWGDITGRLGHAYGQLHLDPRAEEPADGYVLELERDYFLRVRVLDAVGRPAIGVPIVLQPFSEPQQSMFAHYGSMSFVRTEAPDGIALLSHLQVDYRQVLQRPEPPTRWAVNFKVPGWKGPGVDVDPWNPPPEPIELRLPPSGTVELLFTLVPGTELPILFGVQIVQRSPDGKPEGSWSSDGGRDGLLRFLHVVLSKSFVARGQYQALELKRAFDGPTAQDEVVRVELSPGPGAAILRGRAVNGEHEPLADAPLTIQLETNYIMMGGPVTTDHLGWFHFVAGLGEQKPMVREMRIELTADSSQLAELRDLGRLPAGITSVGDVVLAAAPLARGRVLLDGAPCKRPPRLSVFFREPGADQWRSLPESRVMYGDEGTFTVHGSRQAARYRLQSSDWYNALPMTPVEFEADAQDLVVSLHSGCRLEVLLRSPVGFPEGSFRTTLTPAGSQVPEFVSNESWLLNQGLKGRKRVSTDGDGVTMSWPSLWPGPYRLEVSGADGASLAAKDLEVHAGADNQHVVEIAGPLHHHTILVLDVSGEALAHRLEPRIVFVPAGDGEATIVGVYDGRLQVLTRATELQGLIGANGFRTEEFRGVRGEATFRLEPMPTVDLGLRGGLPALPSDHEVGVELWRRDRSEAKDHPWWDRGSEVRKLLAPNPPRRAELDAWGRCQVPLPDGTYRAEVYIWLPGHTLKLSDVEPTVFNVDHGAGQTRFDLDVPAEAFRAALARFAERGK